jgi:hypothetical protein
MRIKKTYKEFILNEAKIHVSDELSQVLNIISTNTPDSETNWAEKMKSLIGNEVETNINYLTTSDNPDMVKWRPDDKANATYLIWMPQRYYKTATESIGGRIPEGEATGRLIRKLSTIEAARLLKGDIKALQMAQFEYQEGHQILHIEFKDRKGKGECFISDKWCKKSPYRATAQDFRMGKLFKSLMLATKWNPSSEEVEHFHTEYVNAVKKLKKMDQDRFEIVEGEEIRKYYLETSYDVLKHTLGNSCMRHARCQSYFDIYVQNPNQIKLLILRSIEDPKKISGRALLWYGLNTRPGDDFEYKWGMKEWTTKANFMDRIFVSNSKEERMFKEWAINNGFLFKSNQDHLPQPISKDTKSREIMTFWIELESGTPKSERFPYMDTMKNYQPEKGVLTNIDQDWGDFDWWELQETNGGNGQCPTCGGTGQAECPECSGDGTIEDINGIEAECTTCAGTGGVDCNRCGD